MNLTDIAVSLSEIPKTSLLPGNKPNDQKVHSALKPIASELLVQELFACPKAGFRYGCYRQHNNICLFFHLIYGKFSKCKLVFTIERGGATLKVAEIDGVEIGDRLETLKDVLQHMLEG